MIRSVKQHRVNTAIHYSHTQVVTESFHLSQVVTADTLATFQNQTGLGDLYWRSMYYRSPGQEMTLDEALLEADGYLFFLHGWNGSHRIWENLPLHLIAAYNKIVCFSLDVNGFGQSPFIKPMPDSNQCSPAALMQTVERWLRETNLWPVSRPGRKPFYLFVGHSMSGAALFFKDIVDWYDEAYAFYALAPALTCNDKQRRAFFKTVGTTIRLPSFTAIKNVLAPHVIQMLGTGASPDVKSEHLRIYNQTSFGTIAQTLYSLGLTTALPQRSDWSRYTVALGHKDRLVSLERMLNLLETLNFEPDQIRVALGDHYFFSHGEGSPLSHKNSRQMVFNDLLTLCFQLNDEISRINKGA